MQHLRNTAKLPVRQARNLLLRAPQDGIDLTRDAELCLCGSPKDAHSGPKHEGRCTSDTCKCNRSCRKYSRNHAYTLAFNAREAISTPHTVTITGWQEIEYPRPRPTPGGTGVGPSDFTSCHRSVQYREVGLPPGYTEDQADEHAAAVGQMIHDAFLRAMASQYPWRYIELEIPLPGMDRNGRIDMYDPVTGIGYDLKSKGDHGWEIVGDDGPDEREWQQLAAYLLALMEHHGETPETMCIIVLYRVNGHVEYHWRDFDEKFARDALGEIQALAAGVEMARAGLLDLPRHGGGPTSDPICRDYCKYKSACWDIPGAAAARRSPENHTLVGDDYDAAADVAARVKAARKAEREAKNEIERLVPMLQGVPTGTYGEYTIRPYSNPRPQYKGYYQTVQDLLARNLPPDQFQARVAELTVPYSRSTSIEVRLVRKAERDPTTPRQLQGDPT